MRIALITPLIAACLSGCLDHARGRMPTAPETVSPAATHQKTDVSDFRDAESASDFWSQLSNDERQQARQTFARVYAEAGDTYAPAQIAITTALPAGTRAFVIRDPEPTNRPTLVFSEQTFNDFNLLLSVSVLSRDVQEEEVPLRRRVLRLTDGGTVIDGSDGSTYWLNEQLREVGPSLRRDLAGRLPLTAASVTNADIPGVGPARLLGFN